MKTLLFFFLFSGHLFAAPLDDIRTTGATVTVTKLAPKQLQKLAVEDRYLLDAQITIQDQAQFNKVKSLIMPGSTLVFSGKKSYSLTEFLPPVAKALVNKTFKTKNWDLSKMIPSLSKPEFSEDPILPGIVGNGLGSLSNCWNTSVEVMRSIHKSWNGQVNLYWPGRDVVTSEMADDEYSTKVLAKEVKPGDVIVFGKKSHVFGSTVLHTAILVSQDVIFEKTDGGDNDPWRLALLSDVASKYKKAIGKELVVNYRRFNKKEIYPTFVENSELESYAKLFKKFVPGVNLNRANFGCEEHLGGLCNPMVTIVETLTLTKDGKLVGSPEALARIKPVK